MESPSFYVAQVNIATPKAPVDSPLLAEFKALLDPVNAIADAAPGFVWRLQDESGNATALRIFDDSMMVNMSVWETVDALWDFVYASDHLAVMRRRREWFARMEHFMCLWWVPADYIPGVADAEERLTHMHEHGPTEHAFTFKQRFGPPAAADPALT